MIVFWAVLFIIICVLVFRPRVSPFRRGDRVVLVTAHPDDECMFFGPTLCHLTDHNIPVKVVCLSTGNFYGRGVQRVKELANAIAVYDGATHLCLDEFRDGPYGWEASKIRAIVDEQVRDFEATVIVTFDGYGISGHRNHKSCSTLGRDGESDAVKSKNGESDVRVLYLESVSISRKFTATLDLVVTSVVGHPFVVAGSWRSIRAMWCHKTQLEWFRLLYIFFSRYMTINSFRVVE